MLHRIYLLPWYSSAWESFISEADICHKITFTYVSGDSQSYWLWLSTLDIQVKKAIYVCIPVYSCKNIKGYFSYLYFSVSCYVTKDYHECKKMKVSRYRRFIRVKRIKLKVHCDKITGNVGHQLLIIKVYRKLTIF